ncbi:hypothetical protein GNI_088040, partial [Gregarina niphandrodes]
TLRSDSLDSYSPRTPHLTSSSSAPPRVFGTLFVIGRAPYWH